jgi:hypothetical protein
MIITHEGKIVVLDGQPVVLGTGVLPTPTITPTITPTPSITPTITPTQSVTPTNTPTITPTQTITPTTSVTPTPTPTSGGFVTDQLFMKLDATNYSGTGNWLDETINGNNGTISGATWLATDGGIFDFDGINDTISIPHNINLSLNTTTQKTIQVWVKFDTSPTGSNRSILFSKLSGGFNFDGYFGGINISNQSVVVTNGTSIAKTTISTSGISLNTWYLFTFISQITNTADSTKVYINDVEYSSTFHGTDGYSEANPLTLGYMPAPLAGLGLIQYLDGKIGACYFYTKGLSVAEISTNFNSTKSKYGL